MKICAIAGFFRRYRCATRIIRMYLLQDYRYSSVLLLYNNGPEIYELSDIELPPNKQIILINNNKELSTGEPYKETGTIFNDSLTFIPDDVGVCQFWDVDDIYAPIHLSEGVKGYKEALRQGKLAYKPYKSYFKYAGQPVKEEHGVMEPSIAVDKKYLVKTGMSPLTASYHHKWIAPLTQSNRMYEPSDTPITFLYWWGGDDGVYKTSSGGDSLEAFEKLRNYEKDGGSNILAPCPTEEIQKYYNLVNWKIKTT